MQILYRIPRPRTSFLQKNAESPAVLRQKKAFPRRRGVPAGERCQRFCVQGRATAAPLETDLPFDVVTHVHQVADALDIVGNVGVAVDGVLDDAGRHRKVDHIHGAVAVHHGVDQAAGKGVAAAHAVQHVEGVQAAFKGVVLVPHKGFEAVLAAGMDIAHMAADTFQVGVTLHKTLEDLVLLLIAGLQGHAVLPVALAVVPLVLPQVVGFDAEQHVHIGQAEGAVIPRGFPAPELAAEVAVKADGQALFLGGAQAAQDKIGAVLVQRRGDARKMQPVEPVEQLVQVHGGKVVLGQGAVHTVVDDLAGADAVAGLQIIRTQTVGGGLLFGGKDHRRAVYVVGAQPAHGAFAQRVVGHHAEEGGIHAQVGKGQGDVGFAAAVAGFKAGRHADLFIVGRGQAQHDFADGDELLRALLALQDGVVMLHKYGHLLFVVGDGGILPDVASIVRHSRRDCKVHPA